MKYQQALMFAVNKKDFSFLFNSILRVSKMDIGELRRVRTTKMAS